MSLHRVKMVNGELVKRGCGAFVWRLLGLLAREDRTATWQAVLCGIVDVGQS